MFKYRYFVKIPMLVKNRHFDYYLCDENCDIFQMSIFDQHFHFCPKLDFYFCLAEKCKTNSSNTIFDYRIRILK